VTGTRRKVDWIQFGILLLSIITLLCTTLIEHGRTEQKLDDHGEQIKEFRQDLKDLDKKLDSKTDDLQKQMLKIREHR
jgi:peptidoglycan hydrolase CwlO-like protein